MFIPCDPGTPGGDSAPVGLAAVLLGLELLDRKDVRIEGRRCDVVSDSIVSNLLFFFVILQVPLAQSLAKASDDLELR
jgi:hypothetical protein